MVNARVTPDQIRNALDAVLDPHMNISLAEMGMLRRITVSESGTAEIGIVFPCIGCPAWQLIQDEIHDSVKALPGVRHVRVRVMWDQTWRKSDIAPQAVARIQTFGYQIHHDSSRPAQPHASDRPLHKEHAT